MPLIVYLDETGDHSLEAEDTDFPVFAIAMLVCDIEIYTQRIVPAVYQLKMDYFGHEGVILHSRDIRKAQGDFKFLRDATQRQPFYARINAIMGEEYQLIACGIRKQAHRELYGVNAENPYDLSLMFALERLLQLLEDAGEKEICIVAESRGKNEDRDLELSFLRTVTKGTQYFSPERFQAIQWTLKFLPKAMNIVGTQMSDLAAYPFARYILDSKSSNPAYDVIKQRFYQRNGKILGCKIFP